MKQAPNMADAPRPFSPSEKRKKVSARGTRRAHGCLEGSGGPGRCSSLKSKSGFGSSGARSLPASERALGPVPLVLRRPAAPPAEQVVGGEQERHPAGRQAGPRQAAGRWFRGAGHRRRASRFRQSARTVRGAGTCSCFVSSWILGCRTRQSTGKPAFWRTWLPEN